MCVPCTCILSCRYLHTHKWGDVETCPSPCQWERIHGCVDMCVLPCDATLRGGVCVCSRLVSVSLHVCECELRCGHVPRPGVPVRPRGSHGAASTCSRAELPCPRPTPSTRWHSLRRGSEWCCTAGAGGRCLRVKDPSALPLHPSARCLLCCVGWGVLAPCREQSWGWGGGELRRGLPTRLRP